MFHSAGGTQRLVRSRAEDRMILDDTDQLDAEHELDPVFLSPLCTRSSLTHSSCKLKATRPETVKIMLSMLAKGNLETFSRIERDGGEGDRTRKEKQTFYRVDGSAKASENMSHSDKSMLNALIPKAYHDHMRHHSTVYNVKKVFCGLQLACYHLHSDCVLFGRRAPKTESPCATSSTSLFLAYGAGVRAETVMVEGATALVDPRNGMRDLGDILTDGEEEYWS